MGRNRERVVPAAPTPEKYQAEVMALAFQHEP